MLLQRVRVGFEADRSEEVRQARVVDGGGIGQRELIKVLRRKDLIFVDAVVATQRRGEAVHVRDVDRSVGEDLAFAVVSCRRRHPSDASTVVGADEVESSAAFAAVPRRVGQGEDVGRQLIVPVLVDVVRERARRHAAQVASDRVDGVVVGVVPRVEQRIVPVPVPRKTVEQDGVVLLLSAVVGDGSDNLRAREGKTVGLQVHRRLLRLREITHEKQRRRQNSRKHTR